MAEGLYDRQSLICVVKAEHIALRVLLNTLILSFSHQADADALALFALEVGDALEARR